jgi:hypothetical protein
MASRIVIEPGNPYEFSEAELEELSARIAEDLPDFEVDTYLRPEHGYGVMLHSVLHVWLDLAPLEGPLITLALGSFVAWSKREIRREKNKKPNVRLRPRSIIIWGPDGKLLRSVVIKDGSGEPTDTTTADNGKLGTRHPPPKKGEASAD